MSRTYSREDILSALENAGLRSNDTVFVTTSLGMLGLAEGVADSEGLNKLFFGVLKEFFGKTGNVIVPTYSYTFGRSSATNLQLFDPDSTPAEVGPFPEFFRKQHGVMRSADPMMSMAGFGPLIPELFNNIPPTSYGEDCVFARLSRIDARCCSIGLGPNWMPFIHHADWLCKAPFRYDKLFKGLLKENDHIRQLTWLYTVRSPHPSSRADGHKIAKLAEDAGIWKHAELGRARVYVADYRRYFDFTIEQLKLNPWMTASGEPDQLQNEKETSGNITPLSDSFKDEEILLNHASFHRCEVCDSSESLTEQLCQAWNLEKQSFFTGENHLDWVIPEHWTVSGAKIEDAEENCIYEESELKNRVFAYSQGCRQSLLKEELLKHVKYSAADNSFPVYHNAVLNRDWGFSLSESELQKVPDGLLQVKIETSFGLGKLALAAAKSRFSTRPIVLLVGYINGPAGGCDLVSAWAANAVYKSLQKDCENSKTDYHLLILPGPAGFAAWLNSNLHLRHRIIGALEFCRLQANEKLMVRLPNNFSDQKLVRLWNKSDRELYAQARENSSSYLLKSGGNPVARNFMPVYEFPVISFGSYLAVENHAEESKSDPFARLQPEDFAALHSTIELINTRQRSYYQD